MSMRPNEVLLSINYFQKDFGDTNPLHLQLWVNMCEGSSGLCPEMCCKCYNGSDFSSDGDERTIYNDANDLADPLIQISEIDVLADKEEIRAKRALDLCLDEQPSTSNQTSSVLDKNHSSVSSPPASHEAKLTIQCEEDHVKDSRMENGEDKFLSIL
ncbi:hypothetical protein Bca52824_007686 [Brassica carinata]|uniref:Uncharacterized protein n=1 Tax=Brassica carinata TaxID=52824 RepID=A0A8X7WAH0_BRACI|nr:hypothetical protein Bca52824_007686 [Brassica carinata]